MFVKICGLRQPKDVDAAITAGAHAVGFVMTDSPRYVGARQAADLVARVPAEVLTVAVFAKEPLSHIRAAVEETGVASVQLHGNYRADDFAALADLPLKTIRAVAGSTTTDLTCGSHHEDFLIVDSTRPGGGQTWDFAALPTRPSGRWMLAGGLQADTIESAIRTARPWGVDVSSGVESSRGVKDAKLIVDFVTAARRHDRS